MAVSVQVRLSLAPFSGFGEPVREGIARFASVCRTWRFSGVTVEDLVTMPDAWYLEAAGYLGSLGGPKGHERLARSGRAAVELLRGGIGEPLVPCVWSDDAATGRMAAEHLLQLGFERLAFLGPPTSGAAVARAAGVCEAVEHAGRDLVAGLSTYPGWTVEATADWLRALPRPLGVIASDDGIAAKLLDAAAMHSIHVPDEVAVVGVNDSLLTCAFSNPPLSSVRPDWERIGFEGAVLLDAMIRGAAPPPEPILIPPVGVTARQSSDVLAVADEDVARAVRWMRQHASTPCDIGDLLHDLPLPRRTLERKFREHFGRSPFQELRRMQIAHVRQLLLSTDWSIARVASFSAFRDARDLSRQFSKYAHETPTGFRRRHRQPRAAAP